ncbi:hypothetical protein RIF29_33548 [Crotalaria pallida]|uniref:Uncharacterized protein n=1 Tax=Crotalaria pallida TaxID=3830 RepID=A0AAN9EDT3_CROPI
MAKKRGKPASPVPSSLGNRKYQDDTNNGSIDIDELQLLKNADISNLSPKQADKVLKVLDELITRIQGKEGFEGEKDQAEKNPGKDLNPCVDSNPNPDVQPMQQADPKEVTSFKVPVEKAKQRSLCRN